MTCKLLHVVTGSDVIWKPLVEQHYSEAAARFKQPGQDKRAGSTGGYQKKKKKKATNSGVFGSLSRLTLEAARKPSLMTSTTWKQVFNSERFWQDRLASELRVKSRGRYTETWEEVYQSECMYRSKCDDLDVDTLYPCGTWREKLEFHRWHSCDRYLDTWWDSSKMSSARTY